MITIIVLVLLNDKQDGKNRYMYTYNMYCILKNRKTYYMYCNSKKIETLHIQYMYQSANNGTTIET